MAIVFELEIGGFFHQTYKIYISDRGEEGDAFSRVKLIFFFALNGTANILAPLHSA
jgi:hypothetical protein